MKEVDEVGNILVAQDVLELQFRDIGALFLMGGYNTDVIFNGGGGPSSLSLMSMQFSKE